MNLKKTLTSVVICAAMAGAAAPAIAQTAPTLPPGRPPSGGQITPLPGNATTNGITTDLIRTCQTRWDNAWWFYDNAFRYPQQYNYWMSMHYDHLNYYMATCNF